MEFSKESNLSILSDDKFGPLLKYLEDPNITDIDYNGRALWVKDIYNQRINAMDQDVTPEFIRNFTMQVANACSKSFNKAEKVLEAETKTLRITCLHETVAVSGRCVCIRKTTQTPRLNYRKAIQDNYCEEPVLNFLINCVLAKFNFVICGAPGVGKTECAKLLSLFIPDGERVVTIEDNPEWHYKELKPKADCIEIKVGGDISYAEALKECMRLNANRVMLSEVRSVEAKSLIELWSSGVKGFTTIHTDDVKKIPDRILNMMPTRLDAERLESNVYEFLDVGILLKTRLDQDENLIRYIDQVYLFSRMDNNNFAIPVVCNGRLIMDEVPVEKMKKLEDMACENSLISARYPFQLNQAILEKGELK